MFDLLKQAGGMLINGFRALNTVVFGVLSALIIAALIASVAGQDQPEVPEGGALVLNLTGPLVEQKSAVDYPTVLRTGQVPKETLVNDVVAALTLAKDDDRIGLVILQLDGLSGGLLPKLERIAEAITDFRESGKKVIATGTFYNQGGVFLSAHADEVLLDPEGMALPEGYAAYRTYYKTLLDDFDVTINLFKVGKYKSAIEPFIRDDMSDEDKEARLAYLTTWWDAYTSTVEEARGLESGMIDSILNDAPDQLREAGGYLGELSLRAGMVDKLMPADERRKYFEELAGKDEETGGYQGIAFMDYLSVARKPVEQKDDRVAVITAVGGIVDGSAEAGSIGSRSLTKLIRKAHEDENVRAIVLRVDSGGGSKSASEIIRRELQHAQDKGIPVVASMASVAASGGYWISSTADQIWALPTTVTGSIGIYGMIPSLENTLDRYGIHSDGVGTTAFAGSRSLERGFTDDARDVTQQVIEYGYAHFLRTVSEGRGMTTDEVHEVAQGRVWSGAKAKALGLVDELGDLEEAIAAAAELAEIEDYSVWHVEKEKSMQEQVIQQFLTEVVVLEQGVQDPFEALFMRVKADFEFLTQLNDPYGAYVICSDCPAGP
ncbi:MAG: signal peptide peptidase SppA [Pseudomonadales bacterium]|nr:signal peptide peptidase SppA [Pseudomonadales bacterium]MBO6597121.1 signal peptide peptidase SppA [Pseudomonadales bacterium]MBO6823692.1 signal peptide peptidase SppA [Pseudomonadales bacterium]